MKKIIIVLGFVLYPSVLFAQAAYDQAKDAMRNMPAPSTQVPDIGAALRQPASPEKTSVYNDAKAIGATQNSSTSGMINNDNAAYVPGGTNTEHPATVYYNPASNNDPASPGTLDPDMLASPAKDEIARCNSLPRRCSTGDTGPDGSNMCRSPSGRTYRAFITDPSCDAVVDGNATAYRDAAGASTSRSFDSPPQIDANFNTAANAIASSYSGCVQEDQVTKAERSEVMLCVDAYPITFNNACTKTLSVTVTYSASCPATATRGPILVTSGPPPTYRCERDTTTYSCNPGDTLAGTTCTPPLPATPYAATPTTTTTVSAATVTPIETDNWSSGCNSMESRVPPGFLPPDGDNRVPSGVPTTGQMDKCLRTSSLCNLPLETRTINGLDVTRGCWEYGNQFTCIESTMTGDCDSMKSGQASAGFTCTEQAGSPYCKPDSVDPATGLCVVREHAFDCIVQSAQTTQVTNCGSQNYCSNGVCYDAGYPPDTDFANGVAGLEAAREAGKYMDTKGTTSDIDPTKVEIFKGFDNRCVRKLGGLINCCSGGGVAELFSDLKATAEKIKELGEDAQKPSAYVADALFSDVAPGWVTAGMTIAGINLTNPMAVFSFIQNFLGGIAWDIAMQAITLFGLFDCAEDSQLTVMKKSQGLCHYVSDYCSDEFLGICFARRNIYCCYNSKLARIINEQARGPDKTGTVQLNKPWGGPNCSGFTAVQLQSLNFSNFDLSEFTETLVYTKDKPGTADSNISTSTTNCATGASCPQKTGSWGATTVPY